MSFSATAHNFVVLPENMYRDAIAQCTRNSPSVTGSWCIMVEELRAIEDDVHKLNAFSKSGKRKYSDYFKQYVGVIIDEKKYIYVNAAKHKKYQRVLPYPINICHGGLDYFGALYDPEEREFSKFEANWF